VDGSEGDPGDGAYALLPDLAPADFFLFRRVYEAFVGTTLDLEQDSLKNAW
jgi:hypothetical protein